MVKDIAQTYGIPIKSLLRRRFRQKNRAIRNGFHPIEIKVDNINEFLISRDILPSIGNGDSFYLRKNDIIATTDERHDYKRVEEFVHALTALPLVSRKKHVHEPVPQPVLQDKEYLDRLLLLDYTHRSGNYPDLRNYLLMEARIRAACNCTDERQMARSKKLIELEELPGERWFVVKHYLNDIATATANGILNLDLYAFEKRVNDY